MACFRLLTLFPLFPDFSFPRFCLCAAVRTLCLAFRLYFRGIRPPQRIREAPETPTRARCAYPMFRLHKKSLSVSGQNPLPVVKSRGLAMEIVQWKPGCETYYGRMLKLERGNRVMIRLFQRVSLALLCGLVLILIPLSTWGQSTAPAQQDRTNQTDVKQTNQNADRTQDRNQYQDRTGQSNPGGTDINRQKAPESSNPGASQNQQNTNTQQNTTRGTQRRNRATNRRNRTNNPSTSEYGSDVNQKNQRDNANRSDNANRALPATGSELPLLALMGFASLIAALATRTFAKSNR